MYTGFTVLYLRMRVYVYTVFTIVLRINTLRITEFAHIILRMWDLRKWDLRHRALPARSTVCFMK